MKSYKLNTLIASGILGLTLLGNANGVYAHKDHEKTDQQALTHQGAHHHMKDMHDQSEHPHHMMQMNHENMHEGHDMHGMMGHSHGGSLAGKPGKASEVDRVIKVEANDTMRFIHEPIKVKEGETIKFVITNTGSVPHEFSIATKDEHMEHGQMMMKNPTMHHGPGGNTVTIAPGQTETLIWKFEEAFEVQAACNIPGHYQAGMHSPVMFTPK
ncbi:MAG: hypothetical protein CUN55_13040 [Phototrophicales bacterium]|nr:MAG: hypothetical protein CUN55_13040 [Phototrophicales bacterium]